MAPILKEADALATTTAAKSPNETPTRPQPVPLEIPVTVNGARTIEGSDKREPFSEATQTVLVFPHGAVIRVATPLAPGQLVFLTNEKTKKEVVCQVVKSKSGGSASGYVELQFTEPAPAFWGLRLPGTVAPPPANVPAIPRPVAPTPPTAKIPAPLPPVPPAAHVPDPAKLPAVPVTSSVKPVITPVASEPVVPPSNVPPAVPISMASAPLVSTPPPSPINGEPVSPSIQNAAQPTTPPPSIARHDYSKEIESLFAAPQAPAPQKPAAPTAPPPPPSSSSSTEELKQQAARLQAQLSTLLFTEAPPAPTKTPAVASEPKLDAPAAEAASTLFGITHDEPTSSSDSAVKNEVVSEPQREIKVDTKAITPARTPVLSSLSAKDEEVEIPAWLRPLSQHSEAVTETPAPVESPADATSSASEPSTPADSASVDSSVRSEAAVFGGQLLSGDSATEPAPSGSKKGLLFGLAAAAVLLAAAGAWYYRQNFSPARATITTPQVSQNLNAPVSEPAAVTSSAPAPATTIRPATNAPAPSSATNSASAHTPVSTPQPAAPAPTSVETRRNNETRSSVPPEEPAKKPSLGDVRLATPVVRGSRAANLSGEALPSIDPPVANSSADSLTDVSHHKAPAAPRPIGGEVKQAQLLKSVPPIYPQLAKTQRVTGNVVLDALIDTSGSVAQVKVISGPPLLHQAALDAVKQWKYSPAQLDGNPTSMHLTVTVQFRTQ